MYEYIYELICKNCQQKFLKKKGEYNRQKKNGREYFFCNLSCSIKYNHKNKKYDYTKSNRNLRKGGQGRKRDDLTAFRKTTTSKKR